MNPAQQPSPQDVPAVQNVQVNVQLLGHVVAGPPGAPLSPPTVRRHSHDAVVKKLATAQSHFDGRWKVATNAYPTIGIHLLGKGGPLLGLLLDASEFDTQGLGVTLTDKGFRSLVVGVPCKTKADHPPLVYTGEPVQRAWFCVPGTREFHRQYADLEPFALIRDRPEANPVEILMRCIEAIDVDALEKGAVNVPR